MGTFLQVMDMINRLYSKFVSIAWLHRSYKRGISSVIHSWIRSLSLLEKMPFVETTNNFNRIIRNKKYVKDLYFKVKSDICKNLQ